MHFRRTQRHWYKYKINSGNITILHLLTLNLFLLILNFSYIVIQPNNEPHPIYKCKPQNSAIFAGNLSFLLFLFWLRSTMITKTLNGLRCQHRKIDYVQSYQQAVQAADFPPLVKQKIQARIAS